MNETDSQSSLLFFSQDLANTSDSYNISSPHEHSSIADNGVFVLDLLTPLAYLGAVPQVRDWLWFMLIGGLSSSIRGTLWPMLSRLYESFFVTAHLKSMDSGYCNYVPLTPINSD